MPENPIYAFSTRASGNMSLCYGETKSALENRQNFLEVLDIDYRNLVCGRQVHGSQVREIQKTDRGKGALSYDTALADTDALITREHHLPLAVFTADCLSIFLYDPKATAIGLVHAGWRSTRGHIVEKAIKLMQDRFRTEPGDLRANFGPAIRSCCYVVAEDFVDYFPRDLIRKDNRYYLDLAEINKKELQNLGVKEENISDCGICTSCRNQEFFSYRKEGSSSGRMISVIMLK